MIPRPKCSRIQRYGIWTGAPPVLAKAAMAASVISRPLNFSYFFTLLGVEQSVVEPEVTSNGFPCRDKFAPIRSPSVFVRRPAVVGTAPTRLPLLGE